MQRPQYIKLSEERYPGKLLYNRVTQEGIDNLDIELVCRKHGAFWRNPYDHLNENYPCPICGPDKPKSNIAQRKRVEELMGREITEEEAYKLKLRGRPSTYELRLKKHRRRYKHDLSKKIYRISAGERKVMAFLERACVSYVRQYKISHVRRYFDFFLPDFNMIIEYHGHQHYVISKAYHKSPSYLLKQREVDGAKKMLAVMAGYKYIEISYLDDIEEKLRFLISENKE